jgi:predicted amidohydrolase
MGSVTIATIQPPSPASDVPVEETAEAALRLLDEAIKRHPDVVCLPEYLNCMRFSETPDPRWFDEGASRLLSAVGRRAAAAGCNAVVPLVVQEGTRRYNRAYVLDRAGKVVGTFDKVHPTRVEREVFRVTPGAEWPVFDLDFGRAGVMICYDGCFSESSRILALGGADILFWPSLQRSYTEEQLTLQMRSHAYFNYVPVVRSSYGGRDDATKRTAEMVGLTGICAADGTLMETLSYESGFVIGEVDLKNGPRGSRSFGGDIGPLRQMRFEDRRPGMYRNISGPPAAPLSAPHYQEGPRAAAMPDEVIE